MLFNSYIFFALFLPVVVICYFLLNSKKLTVASRVWLFLCSMFFYSWWNIKFLPLIMISILFNFAVGMVLGKGLSGRKAVLAFGVAMNVLLLGYFKYADFFIETVSSVLPLHMEPLNLVLPLAISFFTFQQIAYLVDSYKGETREYNFLNYALFVSFFPQLIAGPIVHHKEMMPQFQRMRNKVVNVRNLASGLYIFVIGLFKKVVIADSLSPYVTQVFDTMQSVTVIDAWVASLAYTFQIYFDFSGYMDMALGAALMLNIRLPINFDSPYKSLSIKEFWRRWHITLGRFLREHIYIPLGGNRNSEFAIYTNLMVTFLIGGLWHGAGWTFVFWGFLHGMAVITNRVWERLGVRLNRVVAWLLTFNFLNITWVFFRATSWDSAIKVLKGMFGIGGISFSAGISDAIRVFEALTLESLRTIDDIYIFLLILVLSVVLHRNSHQMGARFVPCGRTLAFVLIAGLLCFMNASAVNEFLYFNF